MVLILKLCLEIQAPVCVCVCVCVCGVTVQMREVWYKCKCVYGGITALGRLTLGPSLGESSLGQGLGRQTHSFLEKCVMSSRLTMMLPLTLSTRSSRSQREDMVTS